jgi:hypothetical protein
MQMQNYPRLPIEEFGKILIESDDLDPIYVALWTMLESDVLDRAKLSRWVMAYICLYHAGLASYMSEYEGDKFFAILMEAAKNETPAPTGGRWPRAKERRHFRGQQAIDATLALHKQYGRTPEKFLDYLAFGGPAPKKAETATFSEVAGRAREHRGVGGWAAFKLADMVDRLGVRPVAFAYEDVAIYETPIKGAELIARQRLGLPETARVKPEVVRGVFDYLEKHFSNYPAPPIGERSIGLNEIE